MKSELHTSYSTCVATVIEHSLRGSCFPLVNDEHAGWTM